MPKPTVRLGGLLKKFEAAEHEALIEQFRVDEVVDERKRHVELLASRTDTLRKRLDELAREETQAALLSGDPSQISAVKNYERRLSKEFTLLKNSLNEAKSDLDRALSRSQSALDEVVEARIEKKKIEQLQSSREASERRRDLAREEESSEEFHGFHRSKKV